MLKYLLVMDSETKKSKNSLYNILNKDLVWNKIKKYIYLLTFFLFIILILILCIFILNIFILIRDPNGTKGIHTISIP